MNLAFITWDVDPSIFEIFGREIRYYGLTWALAFIVSSFVMEKLFSKDGVPKKAVESLTIYIIIGTIVGARLGHCFFYNDNWHYFKNPVEILYIWEGGLASHGAAIGIALALYFFNRKYKMGYLWLMDRLVIVVAISGCLIRFGNLMNSEIVGKPTDANYGFVFPLNFKEGVGQMSYGEAEIIKIKATDKTKEFDSMVLAEYDVTLEYKSNSDISYKQQVYKSLISNYSGDKIRAEDRMMMIDPTPVEQMNFTGRKIKFQAYGVPRHASQMYEAISSLILFILLATLYFKSNLRHYRGKLSGAFLAVLFSLRFAYEYSKEAQESFEEGLALNMGQILSIIPVIIGLLMFFFYNKKEENSPVWVEKESAKKK